MRSCQKKTKTAVFWVKNEFFWSFRGQNGLKTPKVPYRETPKPDKVYSPTWTKMTEGARIKVLSENGQNSCFLVKNEVFGHLGVKMASKHFLKPFWQNFDKWAGV